MTARALRGIRPQVRAALLTCDSIIFVAAAFLATQVGDIRSTSVAGLLTLSVVLMVGSIVVDSRGETARTFDQSDIVRMLAGTVLGAAVALLFEAVPSPLAHASGRLVVIAAMLGFLARMFLRIFAVALRRKIYGRRENGTRTLVIGAGRAAISLVRVIRENRALNYHVVGCVDDDIAPGRVDDVRVLGSLESVSSIIEREKIGCVIISIPSASLLLTKRIVAVCAESSGAGGRPPFVKTFPGVSELLDGGVTVSRLRDIKLENLLQRDPVDELPSSVAPFVRDRVILVTGAGGSIGSELCRQIVAMEPAQLILLGHGENSLFLIDSELREKCNFTRAKIVLADIANPHAVRAAFVRFKPSLVFHAAAHKHVPIVESNICEAVRNNVIGTHHVALAAAATGVAKFVLLSTDKAVNPTSVMGATKRMAELICQSFGKNSATEFITVRFGNVLGSRGSVLTIFRRQLEAGGPLTITHRDMERFFMTIPEAVKLVLKATHIGRDGHVLVLDMGKPIKILSLAETVITLAGFTPYRDVEIVETGMRPGEKLFEELLTTEEGLSRTEHNRLFVALQERVDYETLSKGIRRLFQAVQLSDVSETVAILHEFVPSFSRQQDNEVEFASLNSLAATRLLAETHTDSGSEAIAEDDVKFPLSPSASDKGVDGAIVTYTPLADEDRRDNYQPDVEPELTVR